MKAGGSYREEETFYVRRPNEQGKCVVNHEVLGKLGVLWGFMISTS